MAAPPDSTKVSPAIPMNSASSRCWGLAQSAQPRWPPTDAIRAARPTGPGPGSCCFPAGGIMSGFPRAGRHIGRPRPGQRERDDDPVEQFLADPVGQGGLLKRLVVVDGVVG